MATCNDCIHRTVCVILAVPDAFENTKWDKEPCDHFKAADVAPRAEVEKLQEVNADLNESLRLAAEANKDLRAVVDRLRFNLKAVLDERAEDKAEVAREIFEEIEEYAELQIESLNIVEKVDLSGAAFFGGGKQAFVLLLDRLAELKKKYTEEN